MPAPYKILCDLWHKIRVLTQNFRLNFIPDKPFFIAFMIPFSDEELLAPVQGSLELIRPMLQNDGGDMKLLGIKNGVVYVRLTGHCHGCAASAQTLKYGVERQLRMDIHPELSVVNIPEGEEFEL